MSDAVAVAQPELELPLSSALQRRLRGEYQVDEWGLDDDLVRALFPLTGLRWSIETVGAPHLPVEGGALVIYGRRLGISEQPVLGTAVYRATRRVVRFPGVPDVAPIGPLLRRLGGVQRTVDEVAGVLRARHLVSLPLAREPLSRATAGRARADLLAPALEQAVPVIPAVVIGCEVGWRWTVAFGPPLASTGRRAPLAAEELAEQVRDGVQDLLDEHVRALW